jgi:outer membrane protein assembly factor BamB
VQSKLDLATGATLWRRWLRVGEGMRASPVVARGLAVYAAATPDGSALVARDWQTGERVWRRPLPRNTGFTTLEEPSPVVGGAVLYIATNRGTLHAFAVQNGVPLWSTALADRTFSTPSVADGRVAIATLDGTLTSFAPAP